MEKNNNQRAKGEVTPIVSFEEHAMAVQQFLLRGLCQQITALNYPKLPIIKDMFASAGLVVYTMDEVAHMPPGSNAGDVLIRQRLDHALKLIDQIGVVSGELTDISGSRIKRIRTLVTQVV